MTNYTHPLRIFDNARPDPKHPDWHTDQPSPLPWLREGDQFTCPACAAGLTLDFPHRPGYRFQCLCGAWLTWEQVGTRERQELSEPVCASCGAPMVKRRGKYGEFWGCSQWKKTKCKGKPGPRASVVVVEPVCEIALWQEPVLDDVLDLATRERWEAQEARRRQLTKPRWM